MKTRDEFLLDSRPEIPSARVSVNMCAEEQFQNKTLRPVIKFQNDLLLEAFRNYIQKHKKVFYTLEIEKRLLYIENAIQKDIKFRNSLKGIIIGNFTMDEYIFYTSISSALNKRMMHLVIERIQSHVQLLEEPVAY